jgi:hypothetical protein
MDRIYSIDKRYYKIFRDYCTEHNIKNIYEYRIPKNEANLDNMGIDSWKDLYIEKFEVDIQFHFNKNPNLEKPFQEKSTSSIYPYFDNFSYVDEKNKKIYNCLKIYKNDPIQNKIDADIAPDDIDHFNNVLFLEYNVRWCQFDDIYIIGPEDVVYSKHMNMWVYIYGDNIQYCKDIDDYSNDYVFCENEDGYYYNTVFSNWLGIDIPKSKAEQFTADDGTTDWLYSDDEETLQKFLTEHKLEEELEEEENE